MTPNRPILAKDVMSRFVVTVRPYDTAWTALELMFSHNVGALVVVEGNRPIGIITERDILRSLLSRKGPEELLSIFVQDLMSKNLVTCTPETHLLDVLAKMVEKNIRRVPVIKNGMLEGIITEKDCIRALLDLMQVKA